MGARESGCQTGVRHAVLTPPGQGGGERQDARRAADKIGSVRHNLETVTTCHTTHAALRHTSRHTSLLRSPSEEILLDICWSTVHFSLTFYADDVFAYLLRQERVRHQLDQVVDGVDARVDGLEPLDLLADGQRVGHVGQEVLVAPRHPRQSSL